MAIDQLQRLTTKHDNLAAQLAAHAHDCSRCHNAELARKPTNRCDAGWEMAKAKHRAAVEMWECRTGLAARQSQQAELFDVIELG